MTDFVQYLVDQVINEKLSKHDAIKLLHQFEEGSCSKVICEIHPLLHVNTSTLSEQRFSSTFTGDEFFLSDHIVNGQRVLPGVAYLEMARAAFAKASDISNREHPVSVKLQNVVWSSPIVVGDEGKTIEVGLYPENDGGVAYEIYSEAENLERDATVHSQGRLSFSSAVIAEVLDLNRLREQCARGQLTAERCYAACRKIGFDYGPAFRGIDTVFVGDREVLARLVLPASVSEVRGDYSLHPSLLDSALQAAISLTSGGDGNETFSIKPFFPSSLDELRVIHPCPTSLWAWIKLRQGYGVEEKPSFDIILSDDEGKVCVQMLGFTLLAFEDGNNLVSVAEPLLSVPETTYEEGFELMTFRGEWKEKPLVEKSDTEINRLLCFASKPDTQQRIIKAVKDQNPQVQVIFISKTEVDEPKEDGVLSQDHYAVNYRQRSSYDRAFLNVKRVVDTVDAILYLWGMEDSTCIQDVTGIVYSLQALAASKLTCKQYLLYGRWTAENGSLSDGNGPLERCYLESWIGFERSLGQVLPETQLAAIYQSTDPDKSSDLTDIDLCIQALWKELKADVVQSALYRTDKRYVYQLMPCDLNADTSSSVTLRSGGTYLITGGCGGLGLLFAEYLAKNYSANLILSGRSVLSESKREKLKTLEALGSQVEYIQADVSDLESMAAGVETAKTRFGTIHGVIHAAGVENSQSILEKGMDVFNGVLSPKIAGTLVLDETLNQEPLDFICYFSSSSAILGDFGGCDYAVGNRFLMSYAQYRDQRVKRGECHGKSVVINWSLWREGGMGVESEDLTKMYLQSSGQRFLETDEGVGTFERLLQQESLQHLVVVGRPSRVKRFLGLEQPATPSVSVSEVAMVGKGRRAEMKGFTLSQCIEWDLKELVSTLLKISRDQLNVEDNLAEFGFDSILLARYARSLSAHYDLKITPALFFGYPTLHKLTDYFHEQYADVLGLFYREESKELPAAEKIRKVPASGAVLKRLEHSRSRFSVMRNKTSEIDEPIAIIGMSGRFPQARTVEEMWTILVEGREAVTEIPSERFDWHRYYGDPREGKTNCKWTGCIPGVDEFDPLFFEISPREAITMDPRQRLLLQESWRALEDAGYGETQINKHKIGMFVGVETGDYGALVAQAGENSGGATGNHEGILAARLSYVLNLSGPNMAINTACSSGLVAAHQACLSLRVGECDTAIAAGVNILFRPEPYVVMSEAGMLSEDGKCYTFDHRANGMVPGEAVAVVVLKRLSQAQAEGDSIDAVIVGSGVNYDGKTNGITAPSGVAQTRLLKEVYDHYRIDPEAIEYIVAHGTGTKLGDPIEVNALYDAFKGSTEKQGYCALTSTKTNFGHTFSASGLVSLISLVKAMEHETIPPSLHCEQENDYINWKESPFYVNKSPKPWPAGENKPRLGAVSAFGMSGTNAHMVVQSYDQANNRFLPEVEAPYYLLVLSAKTEESLNTKVGDMLTWLQQPVHARENLAAISYTLLEGRQHFKYRCAVVIQDHEDALYVWKHSGGKEKLPNVFKGVVARDFTEQKALKDYAQGLVTQSSYQRRDKNSYQQTLSALADVYCQGYALDWNVLFESAERHIVHLPTYPFALERYWIEMKNGEWKIERRENSGSLHPFVHQNTSTLSEQQYSATFMGNEFFLSDHIVNGQRVLPGVAYLEMAWAAFAMASDLNHKDHPVSVKLQNVVWSRPIVVGDEGKTIHIGLYPENDGGVAYEIYSEPENPELDATVHGQGRLSFSSAAIAEVLDLDRLREQCARGQLSAERCYSACRQMGLAYGPAFQGIETVWVGEGQVLARLKLPAAASDKSDDLVLHPSLMDSALQASIGLAFEAVGGEEHQTKPALPFALDELTILNSCVSDMWAFVRYSRGSGPDKKLQRLDVDLCDDNGRVCVQFKGFTSRVLEGPLAGSIGEDRKGSLMVQPYWREQPMASVLPESATDQPAVWGEHRVILCEPTEGLHAYLDTQLSHVQCFDLSGGAGEIEARYNTATTQVFEQLQSILRSKPKAPVLVQILLSCEVSSVEGEVSLYAGLFGLLNTAHQENPNLIGQLIEVEADATNASVAECLVENSRVPVTQRLRYRNGTRWVADWREVAGVSVQKENEVSPPWKDGGLYLITGGAGGLGLLFAEDIAQKAKGVRIMLIGRSPLSEEKAARLQALQVNGVMIDYRQVDIADRQSTTDLIQSLEDEYGGLNGILHSAGVIRDNFILNKTLEELQVVLAPKVAGLINLDWASREQDLDFLVVFSSVAGALGNAGQADYAAANAFMDAYAHYRNGLVSAGQRKGKTVSINWPLWKEGGMHIEAESERVMTENTGMVAMRSETGLCAFYRAIAQEGGQWMVLEGDLNRMRQALLDPLNLNVVAARSVSISNEKEKESSSVLAIAEDILKEKAVDYFKRLLSSVIKLPSHRIEADTPLEQYGIDSIMVVQLTNQLEKTFGSLPKTLFFEYQNIEELSGYFLESYAEQLNGLLGIEKNNGKGNHDEKSSQREPALSDNSARVTSQPVISANSRRQRQRFSQPGAETQQSRINGRVDVAIIGLSGRYPQANTVEEFWINLRDGKDCITEIPEGRWDHSLYFDEDKNKPGKTYSKWGGFIQDVDKFDPLYFNISPREAEIIDPQERLFLQCAIETIQDAGYTRNTLGKGEGGAGNVGVYVGVMYEEYQLFGAQETLQGHPIALSGSAASIANRVSYFCNFHGPSMALDTMCSSSLTAIHLACQSLYREECELAIAGGVNVSIHPNKYLMLGQGKFVSSKGHCESFGIGGDGYVPGEGVGAVLLKPLSQAEVDGDHIYGVIKGTAVNHGGKTNGYSVPNPNAQGGVIERVLRESGTDPRTISYIEAHGTGTSLGDPIEIAGLTKAFKASTQDKQFCAIGSAKSNIGHCESAAGIAGVTKVLLQLRHKQLVPSLHSEVLNPNIDFETSPFVVQQSLADWERPAVRIDGQEKEFPRIAGISSFGAGGSNAHIVIQEYISDKNEQRVSNSQQPLLIVLSAKNPARLMESVQTLHGYLEKNPSINRVDLAYTLQVGREAMEERLAMQVSSLEECVEKLKAYLDNQGNPNDIENLFLGKVKHNKETLSVFTADKEFQETVDKWIKRGKYSKLLDLWVKGLEINWVKIYSNSRPQRISLPTYPFARERYWVPESQTPTATVIGSANTTHATVIHPLLHRNVSTLFEQRFSSTFSGGEFFLADHIVNGERVLPGVAYLEMARAALIQAMGIDNGQTFGIQLKNVVWMRPIVVGKKAETVHIGLYPDDDSHVSYEIYSEQLTQEEGPITHGQGQIVIGDGKIAAVLDLRTLRAQCNKRRLSAEDCYKEFNALGMVYGPAHRGIDEVFVGEGQVLAKLSLPESVSATLGDTLSSTQSWVLHPSLMDAGLQASIGLALECEDGEALITKPVLPFAVDELNIFQSCVAVMWVYIRYSRGSSPDKKLQRLDVDLCDGGGRICVQLKGFTSRVLERKTDGKASSAVKRTLMVQPHWREQPVLDFREDKEWGEHWILLCEPVDGWKGNIQEQLKVKSKKVQYLNLQCEDHAIEVRFEAYAVQVFERLKAILANKPNASVLVQLVVPHQADAEGTIEGNEKSVFAGLFGLLKTAHLENPKLIGQLIEVDLESTVDSLVRYVLEGSSITTTEHVRYQGGKRWVLGWQEVDGVSVSNRNVSSLPWCDGGIYLITGGVGGLGLLFANDIAQKVNGARVILVGRSELSTDRAEKLNELCATGADVHYRQVDIADRKSVIDLMQRIQEEFGSLSGIIHSAGINRDSLILNKTQKELREVLAPKVAGFVNLDNASRNMKLDFLVVFSSITGALGNVGQADYAAGNAFMDTYAHYRNYLIEKGQRRGHTVSINWPLWKEGGMHIDAQSELLMEQNTGMVAMQTETGLYAFYDAVAQGGDQRMVIEGDVERIKRSILLIKDTSEKAVLSVGLDAPIGTKNETATFYDKKDLLIDVQSKIAQSISVLLKVDAELIDNDEELSEFGFDSVTLTQLANKLNQEHGLALSPALFFEYSTVHQLADYLIDEYSEIFGRQYTTQIQLETPLAEPDKTTGAVPILDKIALHSEVQAKLTRSISELLKIDNDMVDVDEELNAFGFDSVTLTQFANKLNQNYGLTLSPALFFEYPTVNQLANYLIDEHLSTFTDQIVMSNRSESIARVEQLDTNFAKEAPSIKLHRTRFGRGPSSKTIIFKTNSTETHSPVTDRVKAEPIAIIGISGRFPMSPDVGAFWDNLKIGKDCISEIPGDRWDWQEYYGDPARETNKTNIKWGGFIDGVGEFDPLFFGISPREAQLMDPQQRLLMIYVWKVIEDAGYSSQSLSETNTAIFVGTGSTGYGSLVAQANVAIEGYSSTGAVPSVGPNRMSYFLNLHGPSEPIETACSSALVAIHHAARAMESGECDMAIAGGINTIVTPGGHISFSKAGMLCEDGRCKTFSERANGYVRGEGVGMLFLKRLSEAEQAGDHIYAIIRGSAENHGGRANSLTAPNPKAQAELLKTAYTKAGIDPRSVSYIEAHGTGTSLGDPIEINGLKSAFKSLYKAAGYGKADITHCGLGSVKTNIGHLELAAGIAGVIKVLLQLKHKALVKTLYCEDINPYIDLKDSPFYIVRETGPWQPLKDEHGNVLPRRAGVSSFGFGGVNAHVILEEYMPREGREPTANNEQRTTSNESYIIVLSARSEERLRDVVRNLKDYLVENSIVNMKDLAYTLQVGRDAMEERVGLLINSKEVLIEKLQQYIDCDKNIEGLYSGRVKKNKEMFGTFASDEEFQETIDKWIKRGKHKKVLELWVKGLPIDWSALYTDSKPSRISLPTYPFARDRYWVPEGNTMPVAIAVKSATNTNHFNKDLYDKLFDDVIDKRLSIDSAIARINGNHLS